MSLRRHKESQVASAWKVVRKKLYREMESAHSWKEKEKEKDRSTCSLERSKESSVTAHPVNGKSKASGKLVLRSKAYIQHTGKLTTKTEKVLFIFYSDSKRKGLIEQARFQETKEVERNKDLVVKV